MFARLPLRLSPCTFWWWRDFPAGALSIPRPRAALVELFSSDVRPAIGSGIERDAVLREHVLGYDPLAANPQQSSPKTSGRFGKFTTAVRTAGTALAACMHALPKPPVRAQGNRAGKQAPN